PLARLEDEGSRAARDARTAVLVTVQSFPQRDADAGRSRDAASVSETQPRKGERMKQILSQLGYPLLILIVTSLLTLAGGRVGWATICAPGVSPYLELDGNVGFQNSPAAASFDWANNGANPNGCLTSATQTTPIMCACPNPPCSSTEGGVFDGGQFVN